MKPMQIDRRRLLQAGSAGLLLRPLAGLAAGTGYPRLLEGPMVGATMPDSITIWARASGEFELDVEFTTDPDFGSPLRSAPVRASAATDYTVRLSLTGLQSASRYYYRVRVDGAIDRYRRTPFWTRTAPAGPAPLRVAFGSCARHQLDGEQAIFRAVHAAEPDLFFWLGDNIYADSTEPGVIAEEYRRQRAVPALQPLLRQVPQLAIWDDHDFGLNNSDRSNPARAAALAAFGHYWANPAAGLADCPGVFFDYSWGGIDFFFLDGRYHRAPNTGDDGPQSTMLGASQLAWLRAGLQASQAPFKVLISGSGWSAAEGPGGDTWGAFLTERNALFDFIRVQRITGVVCLSGDTHFGELNCIPWSERGGYDFYDLVSSPLAQHTGDSFLDGEPELRIRGPYFGSVNFGQLDFRWQPEPRLTFTLRDQRGEPVWEPMTLLATELRNGQRSWPDHIDPREQARRARLNLRP